jgi:hypothetical protein
MEACGHVDMWTYMDIYMFICIYKIGWTRTILFANRVGQIYKLAGKSPNIRSYTVYMYDSGQPYLQVKRIKPQLTQCTCSSCAWPALCCFIVCMFPQSELSLNPKPYRIYP